MKRSARSVTVSGVIMLVVSAVVLAPVRPTPPPAPAPPVRLMANALPTQLSPQLPLLTVLLNSPLALLGPAAPLGALPPPPTPTVAAIAPNLADTIDSIYIAVEPWVQYGFEVATAVVRWIPYVGWLAGLIMDGYFFGESIVASAVFNFTDFLRGDGGIIENVVDFGIDVGLAFVWLGLDALATFVPLPPCNCYPPRPPVQGPFLALDTLTSLVEPEQNAKTMAATSFDESSTQGEFGLVETEGEQFETLGEELDLEQGAPGEEDLGELGGEDNGELIEGANGGQELIEEVDTTLEEVDTTLEEVVDLEETDPEEENSNGLPEGELNKEGAEPQAPTSPAPSTDVDGAQQKTADPGGDPGNATTAK